MLRLFFQLRRILKTRCEVPHPNHNINIAFNYETNFLTQYITSLGQILVDQQPIPGAASNQNVMLPMPSSVARSPIVSFVDGILIYFNHIFALWKDVANQILFKFISSCIK